MDREITWVSIPEAARRLGLTQKAVKERLKSGDLESKKGDDKQILVNIPVDPDDSVEKPRAPDAAPSMPPAARSDQNIVINGAGDAETVGSDSGRQPNLALDILLTQGDHFINSGNYEVGINLFMRALSIQPNSMVANDHLFKAYVNTGAIHFDKGQYNECVAHIDKALSLNLSNQIMTNQVVTCILLMGNSLLILGRTSDSIPYLQKACEIFPGNTSYADVLKAALQAVAAQGA